MTARRLAAVLGVVTLVGSAWYLFLYLSRWEWHRAITAGIFLLAAELGLLGGAILTKLSRMEERLDGLEDAVRLARPPAVTAEIRRHLSEQRPAPRTSFAWLQPDSDGTSVFVPVLMGAGFVLTALAWGVERLARATAGPVLEDRLAARLAPLAPPAGGLAPPGPDTPSPSDVRPVHPLDLLAHPVAS